MSDTPLSSKQMNWQPIETAPNDGTEILGYLYTGRIRVIKGNREGSWIDADSQNFDNWYAPEPTHWMPLPELPT
jgi:hypothetical protein